MKALTDAVRSALCTCGLWRDDVCLLAAVSGGCDSVALLHALCRLRPEKNLRIHVIHVQHGLRGEASLADEQFVCELCQSLKVPLAVENAGLAGDMHTPGMETMARERRRAIFEKQLKQLNAHALLTAHHRDDQTETVLMHLLRGSGMRGLCGMQTAAPFGGGLLLRPFLQIDRRQIRDALEGEALGCREDASNQEALTPRNALRLETLPQLEKLFPGAGAHIAQLAQRMQQDEACLTAEADRLYASVCNCEPPLFMLLRAGLAAAPEAIRRRVIRRWYQNGLAAAGLSPQEHALSHADTLALSAAALSDPGTRLNLPCGLMAAVEKDWLHLVHQSGQPLRAAHPFVERITQERTQYVSAHIALSAAPASYLPRDARSVILTREWLDKQPVLRMPQPQDVIHPFGAPGHKPLRRCLTDRKTDPFLRPALPVLCVRNEVLWIPGLCASQLLRVEAVPENGMQITLTGSTPFIPNPPKE